MNFTNNNIKYIILNNDYENNTNQKITKPKHINNIFYYLNEFIDYITTTNQQEIIVTNEETTQQIIEIDFNEFDELFNEPIIIKEETTQQEIINPITNNNISTIITKNITKNEIINYDNFTYNFKNINKPKNENENKNKNENENKSKNENESEEEEYGKFENNNNNNIEEDKLFKLYQMEMMFKDVLINKQNINKNMDVDILNMDNFIDTFIIKSSIRYNIEKKNACY